MDEKGNYFTVLLNDNEYLKNLLTAYLNIIIDLNARYPKSSDENGEQYSVRVENLIPPEEKQGRLNTMNGFRAYATRVKISINTIKTNLPKETLEQLEEDYNVIKTVRMPNYDYCERFVQNVNDLLMNNLNVQSIVKKTV